MAMNVDSASSRQRAGTQAPRLGERVGAAPTRFPSGAVDLSAYRSTPRDWKGAQVTGVIADYLPDVEAAAKRHPELLGKINTTDLAAIMAYTRNPIGNAPLRAQDLTELGGLEAYIKCAASGLNQLPPFRGTVYRGATLRPEVLDQYRKGNVVTERAFTSTSQSKAVAEGFGEVLFEIHSKRAGHNIEYSATGLGNIFEGVDEREVLFTPGTRFKVLDRTVNPRTKRTTIVMEEVL